MGAESLQAVVSVEDGIRDAVFDRGFDLRQVDNPGKTVFVQPSDDGILHGRIFLAVAVNDDDADARVLHVGANHGLFLQIRHQVGVQHLLADFGADRDLVISSLVFGAEHFVACDISFGVRVDTVVDDAIVFCVGSAVDEYADFLLDGLAHGRVQRVALRRALSGGGHGCGKRRRRPREAEGERRQPCPDSFHIHSSPLFPFLYIFSIQMLKTLLEKNKMKIKN